MISRSAQRRRLNLCWLLWPVLGIAPWLVVTLADLGWTLNSLRTPVFMLGLFSFFVTLPLFRRYKLALWAMQQRDEAGETQRWHSLASAQQRGLLVGSLPAWIAVLGELIGLDAIAGLLLVVASVLIYWLYRIPAQVSLP